MQANDCNMAWFFHNWNVLGYLLKVIEKEESDERMEIG